MGMMNCLSKINFFKVPVRLKVNKSDFYSSGPGEILSLFIIGILLYMLATHDLFYKRNPETFEKSLAREKYYTFNFTLDNFFIAVKIAGFGGKGLDYNPSIYSFQVTYVTSTVNASGLAVQEFSVIDMVPCIDSPYYEKFKYIIDLHPTSMCLPKSEFQLIGSYTEKKISKVFISLRKCENSTLNNNFCKTRDEIEQFLGGKYFGYTYLDNQIDLTNYLRPIQTKTPIFYKAIEPKIRKKNYYKTNNALIKSDVGFLMESIEEDKTWIFEQNYEDFDFANNLGLMELHFLSNNVERTFIRRYTKIQDAMANLGGMLNFLVMSCYVILKLVPFTGVDYLLSKKLFSYKKSKKKREKSWKEIKKKDLTTTITEAKSNLFIPNNSFSNIKYPSLPNCKSNPESPRNNNEPKLNEITKLPLDCLLHPKSVKISFNSGDTDLNYDIPNDQQILGNFQKKLETMRGLSKFKLALQACQSLHRYNRLGLTDQDRQAQLINLDMVLYQQCLSQHRPKNMPRTRSYCFRIIFAPRSLKRDVIGGQPTYLTSYILQMSTSPETLLHRR